MLVNGNAMIGIKVQDAWFISTDLGWLPSAISADKQRMGIEEMFRDCKTGCYNLEGNSFRESRLTKMILLMVIAYSSAIFQGIEIQKKQVQRYVFRRSELIKNTVYGVHLALARMENSGLIISIDIH
ncbi:hypothetical protein [Microcoleus sp. B4-D4]|uniref:hypothetical protein n=1 Tax=Microcoleus sp. B4-D4 TaxID=2818667 RepID=UPI002FCFA97D